MQLRRTLTAAVLGASLVAAAPAAADAHRGHGGAQGAERGNVPSRVATRLNRAERALTRASDAVDSGDATAATSALKSVRTNLASALKSAKRTVNTSKGPAAYRAVASAQHDVVDQVASLYDGADDATVSALTQTLNAAIDGRDDLVASIAALDASGQASYAGVLNAIDDDVTSEIDSIDQALQDDTLTAQARSDLTAARAKLVATQSAVQGLGASQSASQSTADESGTAADGQDCPNGGRSRGSGSASQEVPAT